MENRMENRMFRRVMILITLIVGIGLIGSPLKAADTFKIATFEPMSGPFKYLGDLGVSSVQFHASKYNEEGGLMGKKIEIVPYDSQMKPEVAVKEATKALLEDKVNVLCSQIGSHIAQALSQLARKHKVIYVNCGAEAASLTGEDCNPYHFRVSLNTSSHSKALAAFLVAYPDVKRIGIIAQDYNFGREASADFKKHLKVFRPDIEIAVEIYHPLMTKDFAPYITKLNAANVPWIFSSNFGPDLTYLLKQGENLGLKGRLLTYYVEEPFLLRDVQQAAVGHVQADIGSMANPHAKNKELLENWHKNYKKFVKSDDTIYQWPHAATFHSYYIRMLFEAVKKAGTFDTKSVIKAWEGLKYTGMTGEVVMRAEDHQLSSPVPVVEIIPKSENKLDPSYPGSKFLKMIPIDEASVPLSETGCKRKAGEM